MTRRIASLVAAVAVLIGISGVGTARADFHGTCTPKAEAFAMAHLNLSGSTLTYTGEVNCGANTATIDSLVLTVVDATGHTTMSAFTPTCSNCPNPKAIGTYTVTGPGQYSVYMAFSVHGIAPQRFRTQRAVSNGTKLTVICGGTDGANQQITCPVPEGMAEIPAPASAYPDVGVDD